MSDAPLPPQTDYPYAARVHLGPPPEAPSSKTPSFFVRIAERLDIALDWQPSEPLLPEGGLLPVSVLVFGACAFAVINVLPFVAFEVLDSPPPWLGILIVAPLFGIIAGEFLIFAILLVWWRGNFLMRLATHWLVALSLFCCWALGFAAYCSLENRGAQPTWDDGWTVFSAIPMICIALQTPLWCLRIYCGWRLKDPLADPQPAPPTTLSIRDVMLGTTVVAASVTMLRAMFDKPEKFGDDFWIGWGIAFPCLALVSVLAIAPLMWLILSSWNVLLVVIIGFGYWLLLAAIASSVFLYLDPDGEGKAMALGLSLTTWTGFATVSIPLWIARAGGYRLSASK